MIVNSRDMTTTSNYQIYPDFFPTPQQANTKRERIQTNPKYHGFTQTHFTAGDAQQFEDHRYPGVSTGATPTNPIKIDGNITNDVDIWDGYTNVAQSTVKDTFDYIFHKFKKGIFVKIRDNSVKVFLPFSKHDYTNEWSDNIKMSRDEITNLVKEVDSANGYKFNPRRLNTNIDKWYANNSLIRYEYPLTEGDSNVGNVKNMLEELCKEREIPDTEFFVNRRDFPLLTRDRTEPYHNMWNSDDVPLVSHSYEKYIPILSMSTSGNYADIAIPTHNDWSRVQSKHGKWFPKGSDNYDDDFTEISWSDKIETAVFRGASTGTGVDANTNMRMKAALMSQNQPKTEIPLLNAGISKWNLRPRKIEDCDKLRTINVAASGIKLSDFMTIGEQAKYKYILHIDGHVSAFRLSMELATRSLILKVDSPWKTWISDKLKPYVHYVPVNWDLSNLFEIIEWCRNNDDKCKEIASNARAFYESNLSRNSILDYLQALICKTTSAMNAPKYPDISPKAAMIADERRVIQMEQCDINLTNEEIDIGTVFRETKQFQNTLEKVKNVLATSKWEDVAERGEILNADKQSRLVSCTYDNMHMTVSCSESANKKDELIHGAFVGMLVANKLDEITGNFCRTYGVYETGDTQKVISERVYGQTLGEYISNIKSNFKFAELRYIIVQIFLALHVAQSKYGFVHNNLNATNIIIHRFPGIKTASYEIGTNETVTVKVRAVPIITNYDNSNVVYDGKQHNVCTEVETNYTDTQTFMKSVIWGLLNTKLSKDDLKSTINLAGMFSSGTIKNVMDVKSMLNDPSGFRTMSCTEYVKMFRKHVYMQ